MHTQVLSTVELSNSELRETESFIKDFKQSYLTLVPEGDITVIMLASKQTIPMLLDDMLSVSSKAIYYIIIP